MPAKSMAPPAQSVAAIHQEDLVLFFLSYFFPSPPLFLPYTLQNGWLVLMDKHLEPEVFRLLFSDLLLRTQIRPLIRTAALVAKVGARLLLQANGSAVLTEAEAVLVGRLRHVLLLLLGGVGGGWLPRLHVVAALAAAVLGLLPVPALRDEPLGEEDQDHDREQEDDQAGKDVVVLRALGQLEATLAGHVSVECAKGGGGGEMFVWGASVERNSQKRVHDAHGYDDPAHPHVHGSQLGRLLRLLVDAVVHEAEGELRDDEDEQQDADDLVGAVELLGLGEMVYCQYKSQTIPLSLFPSFFPADTTDRRK